MSVHGHIQIWNYTKQKYASIPFTSIDFCFLFLWLCNFLFYLYFVIAYPAISALACLFAVTEF